LNYNIGKMIKNEKPMFLGAERIQYNHG